MRGTMALATGLALVLSTLTSAQQPRRTVIVGPNVGPSPYTVVRGWHKPFAREGFAFGGNSGVFAASPDRIFIAQRGEARLPQPVPAGFAGFAGSIGLNVLTATSARTWQNCLYTLDGNGNVRERWTQWDRLCEGSDGPVLIACASAPTIESSVSGLSTRRSTRFTCSRTTVRSCS